MRNTFIIIILVLFIGCNANESGAPLSAEGNGKGGSMSRFAVSGDALYVLSNDSLKIFNISDPLAPKKQNTISLNANVETIFPYNEHIFFGTTTGMLIYDKTSPFSPVYISTYAHIRSCDPVVVQGNYAYVTLRNGTFCGGVNSLDIIDLKKIEDPQLVKSYPMTNPFGLGIDGDKLFVCDGYSGLKVFDVSDPLRLTMTHQFENVQTFDVIPNSGNLIMTGDDGLFQFDYTSADSLVLLSKIPIIQ